MMNIQQSFTVAKTVRILMLFPLWFMLIQNSLAQESDRVKEEIFGTTEAAILRAEMQDLQMLSPNHFETAKRLYLEGIEAYERGSDLKGIYDTLDRVQDEINTAMESAQIARLIMHSLLETREQTFQLLDILWADSLSRSAYYYGKLLKEGDFLDEQSYHNGRAEMTFRKAIEKVEAGDVCEARSIADSAGIEYRSDVMQILENVLLQVTKEELKRTTKDTTGKTLRDVEVQFNEIAEWLHKPSTNNLRIQEIVDDVYSRMVRVMNKAMGQEDDFIESDYRIDVSSSKLVKKGSGDHQGLIEDIKITDPSKLALSPTSIRIDNPNPSPNARFGWSVAGINDINNDGVSDIIVGAPGADKVFCISGANRSVIYTIKDPHGYKGYQFGFAVCAIGDVNGDMVEDIAIGSPGLEDPNAIAPAPIPTIPSLNGGSKPPKPQPPPAGQGRAFIFSGKNGKLIRMLNPKPGNYKQFGWSLASLGDVTGDKVPDVAVSAPGLVHYIKQGRAYGFSGSDGSQLWLTGEGKQPLPTFGYEMVSIGDLDGDNRRDLLIAAVTHDADSDPNVYLLAGRVYLVNGAQSPFFRVHDNPSPADNDWYGGRLAAVGDQDNDGVEDYVIGMRRSMGWITFESTYFLHSGKKGKLIQAFKSPVDERKWGMISFANVGDKDKDGKDDFWVGGYATGAVYLMNCNGKSLMKVADPTPNFHGEFGRSIAPVGNIGGDIGHDLIAGEPKEASGAGVIYVIMLPAVPSDRVVYYDGRDRFDIYLSWLRRSNIRIADLKKASNALHRIAETLSPVSGDSLDRENQLAYDDWLRRKGDEMTRLADRWQLFQESSKNAMNDYIQIFLLLCTEIENESRKFLSISKSLGSKHDSVINVISNLK